MRLLVALVLLLGCATTVPVQAIEVSNQTALAVTLVVNGTALRTFPPGVVGTVGLSDLPPLPWSVEARSPSGRALTSMHVRPGDVRETTNPDGSRMYVGAATRVDLSCGRLDVWSGPPLAGPMPGPGKAGDCAP